MDLILLIYNKYNTLTVTERRKLKKASRNLREVCKIDENLFITKLC